MHWPIEEASLWEKISWWAKFSKNWLKKTAKLAPWMEEGTQNLLAILEVVVCYGFQA